MRELIEKRNVEDRYDECCHCRSSSDKEENECSGTEEMNWENAKGKSGKKAKGLLDNVAEKRNSEECPDCDGRNG